MRPLFYIAFIVSLATPARAHDEDADDAAAVLHPQSQKEPSEDVKEATPPEVPEAQKDVAADDTVLARQHYQAGLEAFRAARYQVAIDELNQAYELKPLPLLLVNIGTTYRKMGDNDRAALFLKKYLEDAPPDARDRREVAAALEQVERARGQLAHDVIETAPPDTPVDIRAQSSRPDGRVYLFYRRSGAPAFTRVVMRTDGDDKVGRIPAHVLHGAGMEYYLEGRDKENRVWRRVGEPQKPNVVLVDPEAPPRIGSTPRKEKPEDSRLTQMDEELAPLTTQPAPRRRKLGGVFYGGLALALIGAGGVALGVAGGLIAQQQANALTHDAGHTPAYSFSDPTAPGGMDDASFYAKGQLWNTIAIAGSAAGGALLGSGLIMMIADAARKPAAAKRSPLRPAEPTTRD
jgi:tetratricopeptide (TPR) repeat protein